MPLPSNNYYPLFPMQIQTVDKDTGLPLAAGTYTFYRDISRNSSLITKPVYQRTENPDNTFTYAPLPNPLVLSSIGTFVDDSGNNIIPFMWPFLGLPTDVPPSTTIDLYYVVVESSGSISEFTTSAWPPQVSGSAPGGDIFSSDNIISNPQFAVLNYPSPYTFNVSGNSVIRIAPDWDLITTGTGTVTINQLPSIDPAAPGVPAFGLDIINAGVNTIILGQRIHNSPRILENGRVAGTFIAEGVTGTSSISMNFVPSNPSMTPINIITGTAQLGTFSPAISGNVNLAGITKNPDGGDIGYIDIQLVLAINSHVYISCIQLISVSNALTQPAYIQETTPRQIDHLYHDAYPIVPVGSIIDFGGFGIPPHYLLCDGTQYLRAQYFQLWNALTISQSITQLTATTFTVTSTSQLRAWNSLTPPPASLGNYIEGPGIPYGTYITGISGSTITVNQSTTATGTFTAIFYAWGQGDNSFNYFNTPALNGIGTAGSNGNIITNNGNDQVGLLGGDTTYTLTTANTPPHTHNLVWPTADSVNNLVYNAPGTSGGSYNPPTGGGLFILGYPTIQSTPAASAFSLQQQTAIVSKCIRFE